MELLFPPFPRKTCFPSERYRNELSFKIAHNDLVQSHARLFCPLPRAVVCAVRRGDRDQCRFQQLRGHQRPGTSAACTIRRSTCPSWRRARETRGVSVESCWDVGRVSWLARYRLIRRRVRGDRTSIARRFHHQPARAGTRGVSVQSCWDVGRVSWLTRHRLIRRRATATQPATERSQHLRDASPRGRGGDGRWRGGWWSPGTMGVA